MKKLLILLLMFGILKYASAQADRAKIMAAYVVNFSKYTVWPDEDKLTEFNIAVVTDDREVKKEFGDLAGKRKIKDKPVNISFHSGLPNLKKIQLVLITQKKTDLLLEIYENIGTSPVLIVSEGYKDKRNVMINIFETTGQLQFEVNKANIINQKLSIDPEILLAGGTEIDVAALYRAAQFNLRSQQKTLDRLTDSINSLNSEIKLSVNRIQKLQTEMDNQNLEIGKQKKLLSAYDQKTDSLQKYIEKQWAVLKIQQDSVDLKNKVLINQQNNINNQLVELDKLEEVLVAKQSQIEELNNEIDSKNASLGNQSETILKQRQILYLLIIIGILTIFLGFSILIALISNRRKSKSLASKNLEIEQKLHELNQLNEKLKNADQYKSIFLASMSHELRTPLNSIIGYTGILLMGMTGKLNDEQNRQLTKVKNNARHLLSLINDILDISKIEADRVELQIEEVNVRNLINEVIEIVHPKAIEKQLRVFAIAPPDMMIITDLRRLKQIILNLTINAINYTNEGEIQVHAEKLPEDKLRITVKDTGVGIAEAELPRLFQPFQQVDASLTKKNKGTGLGLYLSRKIVNLLKGEIFVKSQFGKGSEFFVELPVKIS